MLFQNYYFEGYLPIPIISVDKNMDNAVQLQS